MSPSPTANRRIVRAVVAVVVLVALVGGGAAAVSARRSDGASGYRTATVAEQTVQQTLAGVGTVEPVQQASVAFPTAGTVDTVRVEVGDHVAVGEELATLDAESLQDDLIDAEASLAAAELTLHQALNGETITGGGGSGNPSGMGAVPAAYTPDEVTFSYASASVSDTGPTTTTRPTATTPTTKDPELGSAQQAVLDAQKQVDADLATAKADLAAATEACAGTTGTSSADATTTTTTTSTTPPTTPPTTVDTEACRTALQQVLADQQTVAADQDALAKASDALNALIQQRLVEGQSTAPTTTPQGPGGNGGSIPNGATGTGGSGTVPSNGSSPSDGSGATSGSSPSAEQLVAYQAAVDAAAAKVAVAQQAISRSTIVSPIAGTVGSVGIEPGDGVTAASSTDTIIVTGSGGYEVSTNISVDDLNDIEVGQTASVSPDGTDADLTGKIVSIGVAADSSSSTVTYPVTIGFTGKTNGLRNGLTAAVTIVTDKTRNALAVPTSAITEVAGRHTVDVLTDGKVSTVTVQIGAKGGVHTAVTSGLKAGQEVVLADLSEPLPTSATSSSNGTSGTRTGGNGGFIIPSGGGFPTGGQRPGG